MKRFAAAAVTALACALAPTACLGRFSHPGVQDSAARDHLRAWSITYATKQGLYRARGDGTDPHLLLRAGDLGPGGAIFMPALSPDGRSLLFLGLVGLDVRDSTGHGLSLNILSLQGDRIAGWRSVGLERLAPPREDGRYEVFTASAVAWSRDGRSIALALHHPADRGDDEVLILDAQGAPLRSFGLGERSLARISAISWSPEGRSLLVGLEGAGDEAEGGIVARVSLGVGADGPAGTITPIGPGAFPAISPDGRSIAVVDTREGQWDLVLLAEDGRQMRRFTRPAGRALNRPFWSPDGQFLYYYSLASTGPLGLIEITMLRCLDTRDSRVFDLVRLG